MSQDRFLELVTREFIGGLNSTEAEELHTLLKQEELAARYNSLRFYLSNNYDHYSSDEAGFEKVKQKIHQHESSSTTPERAVNTSWLWKAAAVIIIAGSLFFLLPGRDDSIYKVALAKRASKKSIALSDGTKVILNADSKLSYPEQFTGPNREVKLEGEAFFDVAKDTKHPFIIHTKKMDVRVLGTAFNVKSYNDDNYAETTLLRGKVEVTLKDRPSDRITLTPSEKLTIKYDDFHQKHKMPTKGNYTLAEITHLQKQDTTILETSWLYDQLVFNDETFGEISRKLERAYDVEIEFKNQNLEDIRFTASFRRESLADILKALNVVEPFSYQMRDNVITIK